MKAKIESNLRNYNKYNKLKIKDFKYNNILFNSFLNKLSKNGNKNKINRIFFNNLKLLKRIFKINLNFFFEKFVEYYKPFIYVKNRKIRGQDYKVPQIITKKKAQNILLNWILELTLKNTEKNLHLKLFHEFFKIFNKFPWFYSNLKKKNLEIVKIIEKNKPFSHYRW